MKIEKKALIGLTALTAIGLIILFFALLGVFTTLSAFPKISKAQTSVTTANDFEVRWYPLVDELTHKEYLVEIQNLDPDMARDFNLSVIISDTSFPLNQISNLWVYEWKALNQSFPTYDVRVVNATYTYNATNTTNFTLPTNCNWLNDTPQDVADYICFYNETYQNGTVWKMKNDWKPTKIALITQTDKVRADYGVINIPKLGSKEKYDDFGDVETVNGTKKFKIAFDVPITKLTNGWGSYGLVGILEANSNEFYHPWWNTTWQYRRAITINNTQNSNTLTDYQVAINLTYSSNMQPDFSDIRFTWYNSTDGSEIEIPYWIESKVNSTWAYVWVKVPYIPASSTATIYVYYGNPSATSLSNGTAVFAFYDDFNDRTTLGNWTVVIGSWQVFGGTLNETSGTSGTWNRIYAPVSMTTNFMIEADINVYAKVAYYPQAYISYYADVSANGRAGFEIQRDYRELALINGTWYELSNPCGWDFVYNYWYRLSVSKIGNYLNVSISNSTGTCLLFQNYPETGTPSKFGFVSYEGKTAFDNFRVRKYSLPEPTYSIGAEEIPSVVTATNNYPTNNGEVEEWSWFNATAYTTSPGATKISNCTLYWNESGSFQPVTTLTEIQNNTMFGVNLTLKLQSYQFYWSCYDDTNNQGQSPTWIVTSFRNVSGQTLDENNNPLANITVLLIDQATNQVEFNLTSNLGGWWWIKIYTPRNYTIVAYDPTNSTRAGSIKPWVEVS
jgi:hypothetical protein